jgi:hypothetical protein
VARDQAPRRSEDEDAALDRRRDRFRDCAEPAPFQGWAGEELLQRDRPAQAVIVWCRLEASFLDEGVD